MGFRDEELAGRAKVESLQAELDALRAENAELKAGRAIRRAPTTSRGAGWIAGGALGVALVVALVVARLPIPAVIMPSILIVALLTTVAVLALVLSRLLYVVRPDEVLVLSGRRTIGPDGSVRGYRWITSGRALRIPLLETAHVLDLRPFTLERTLEGLPTRDGGAVALRLRYEARITRDDDRLHDAVERFLDAAPGALRAAVDEPVEAAARWIASESSGQRLREDTEAAAEYVHEEAAAELSDRGIDLRSVTLLEVRD